jgi:hypothetical protein
VAALSQIAAYVVDGSRGVEVMTHLPIPEAGAAIEGLAAAFYAWRMRRVVVLVSEGFNVSRRLRGSKKNTSQSVQGVRVR